jgi:hypothetical protein
MRGRAKKQASMLHFVDPETLIPADHPLRTIKRRRCCAARVVAAVRPDVRRGRAVGVFRGGEHRRRVVAGVAGLARGHVGVVGVQVVHKRPVVEGSPIWGRLTAADECAAFGAAEVVELSSYQPHRFAIERAPARSRAHQARGFLAAGRAVGERSS